MRSRSDSNKTKRCRDKAFRIQGGLCFYCHNPMWLRTGLHEFAKIYQISFEDARLRQCTGDHVLELKNGGQTSQGNVVATCLYCNLKRDGQTFNRIPVDIISRASKRHRRS